MSFDKIPGQLGYLVLKKNGTILSSGGELENDEKLATTFHQIVWTATKGDFGTEVDKLTVNYADHCYVITSSNSNIQIVKKNVSEIFA